MAYWLFKSEPNSWSWQDQLAKGEMGEEWDGVRNYLARNNMMRMKRGEFGFFYHSVKEKQIVGIVQIINEAHQDSTTKDERWKCVDVKAYKSLPNPVTLAQIKDEPALQNIALIKMSRLSVMELSRQEFIKICQMGGLSEQEIKEMAA